MGEVDRTVDGDQDAIEQARRRYGADRVDTVQRFQPTGFARRLALRDQLDPAFTKTWLNYFAGLFSRPHLDIRTRVLLLTGQLTMTKNPARLREVIELAIQEGVDLREVLEVILQCFIYGGDTIVDQPLEVFYDVVASHGRLADLTDTQLPIDGPERDLEAERKLWDEADLADPRLEKLLERYGWRGVSTGLILRPRHVLNSIGFLDSLDPDFARLWVECIYDRMYSRMVLDHKTRLLCMVGDLLAVGEGVQSRHHMRGALRQGAKPEELLEIVMQTCVMFGHEYMTPQAALDVVRIAKEETGIVLAEIPEAWQERTSGDGK